MAFIYKIENLINNKVYIGKSKYNNENYLRSGLKISNAIKKYGKEQFTKTILEECSDDIVSDREIWWIQKYNSTDEKIGYNVSKGGTGGDHYWSTLTDEEKKRHNQKISDSVSNKPRKPRSEITKNKLRAAMSRKSLDFFKQRAASRRKTYTCVNHIARQMYYSNNLKEFCIQFNLNYDNMLYNARTKKSLYNGTWSCREDVLVGNIDEIILKLDTEIKEIQDQIKEKIKSVNKHGSNNSRAINISFIHDSGVIVNFNGNMYKDCNKILDISYYMISKLIKKELHTIDGWKIYEKNS